MKVIRKSVFETNSSSMHSIAVPKEYFNGTAKESKSNIAISNKVTLGDFQWADRIYTDETTKLSYALTQLYMQACHKLYEDGYTYEKINDKVILNTMKEFDMYKDIELIVKDETDRDLVIDFDDRYVGIDHQSVCNDFYKLLSDNNITLRQFIFDENISLIIDDDNTGKFSDFRKTQREKGFKIIFTEVGDYRDDDE